MAITKRIVCLANSRKLQGRCIAGREIVGDRPGAWIRPVSDREHEEVSEYEREYEDGSDPSVLDIIEVPLREPRPSGCQQENWLLDPNEYWARVGRWPWTDLDQLADNSGTLWINGYHTYSGQNDQIPLDRMATVGSSLKLIRVSRLVLNVFTSGGVFGPAKRRVQARFRFVKDDYAFWVTDPTIERAYLARKNGEYHLGKSYLTISLGEPFRGYCYKLVAAAIQQE